MVQRPAVLHLDPRRKAAFRLGQSIRPAPCLPMQGRLLPERPATMVEPQCLVDQCPADQCREFPRMAACRVGQRPRRRLYPLFPSPHPPSPTHLKE